MSGLPNGISQLSEIEKFELIDALWEDLASLAPRLTEAQQAELDHRVARYEQNKSVAVPWDQVRANALKRL